MEPMNLNGTWQAPALDPLSDIDAPHPSSFAKVEVREMTDWIPTNDAKPVPKSDAVSTMCCMAEEIVYDGYGGEVSVKPIVKHKFYDEKQKRWDRDIATSELNADRFMTVRTPTAVIPGLKDRFGKAIADYEKRLARDGRSLPIVLLADNVYPAAIAACESLQISTVNALASADKPLLSKLEGHLRKSGHQRMADQVKRFQEVAQARLESLGVSYEGKGKKAA
jgi:hypothetical protein